MRPQLLIYLRAMTSTRTRSLACTALARRRNYLGLDTQRENKLSHGRNGATFGQEPVECVPSEIVEVSSAPVTTSTY